MLVLVCRALTADVSVVPLLATKTAFHVPVGTAHEVVRLNFPFGHDVAVIVEAKRGLVDGDVESLHAIAAKARTTRYLFTFGSSAKGFQSPEVGALTSGPASRSAADK